MIDRERPVSGGFLAPAPAEAVKTSSRSEVAIPAAVFIDPGWPADPDPDDDGE